jgi:hypothetical protein
MLCVDIDALRTRRLTKRRSALDNPYTAASAEHANLPGRSWPALGSAAAVLVRAGHQSARVDDFHYCWAQRATDGLDRRETATAYGQDRGAGGAV